MHSTPNEGKSVVAERFIRNLENKIYRYLTSVSKNVYIHELDDIAKKYKNTYHSTIKMKPVDVKLSRSFDSSKENRIKILNLKLVNIKIKKYFCKNVTLQIGLKKFL